MRAATKSVMWFWIILTLVFLPMIVASTTLAQAAQPGEVRVEYDKHNDLTKITLNPIVLAGRKQEELRLGVLASYKGQKIVTPKEVALVFISLSASDANKYENAHRLTIWADGQRFSLGEAVRAKQAQNAVSIEILTLVVPYDTFSQIVRAKEVTLRLGETQLKLTSDQITALRAAEGYTTQK